MSDHMAAGKRVSYTVKRHLALVSLLILTACGPATPSPGLSPSATPSPSPTSTELPSPESTPSPSPAPSATAVPTAITTRTPVTPAPDFAQALRTPFREDERQFPNATRYDLELTVDMEEATVTGHEEISYTNTEDVSLNALYLRLFPNTPGYGGAMTVTYLTLEGQVVQPIEELEGSALRIPLEPPLSPEARVGLALDFTLALPSNGDPTSSQAPAGGYRQLGTYEGVVALANAYPLVPAYDDEGWNVELAPSYGDAVYSDVAFFEVHISAPATMRLFASGPCRSSTSDAGTASWSCIAAPMRDFNAILGEDYQVKSRDVRGTTVNSVFYAEHDEGGSRALDYASQAVRLFDRRIGPYPFTELDVVETPTLAGGIEYPGLVVINSSYHGAEGGRMEWVVVHEVLHQWWYSLVGNDQVDDPWLDEALVQYCTLLYFEEQYGHDVAETLLESVFQQPYEELRGSERDKPVGLPVAAYNSRDYGVVVYQKGPLYFHALRQVVGEEAFWEILQTYFERNRYRIATPEDWLAAVDAVSGEQHQSLYKAWISGE